MTLLLLGVALPVHKEQASAAVALTIRNVACAISEKNQEGNPEKPELQVPNHKTMRGDFVYCDGSCICY